MDYNGKETCDLYTRLCVEGKNMVQIMDIMGQDVMNWIQTHSEFREAASVANQYYQYIYGTKPRPIGKYDPQSTPQLYSLLRTNGASNAKISEYFEVSLRTMRGWIKNWPGFAKVFIPDETIDEDKPKEKDGRESYSGHETCEIYRKLIADGMENSDIPKKLGVSTPTLYRWLKEYPEMERARMEGTIELYTKKLGQWE